MFVLSLLFIIPTTPIPVVTPELSPEPREVLESPPDPVAVWDQDGPIALTDLQWFNLTVEEAHRGYSFASKHVEWIESRWWDNAVWSREWFQWTCEANRAKEIWLELYYASLPRSGYDCRLNHLKTLRQHLGTEAYYSGKLPPPAPFWRFVER